MGDHKAWDLGPCKVCGKDYIAELTLTLSQKWTHKTPVRWYLGKNLSINLQFSLRNL